MDAHRLSAKVIATLPVPAARRQVPATPTA